MIAAEVLDFLEEQARSSPDRETGGIIAGCGTVGDGTAMILKASDGGPAALRRRGFFSRDTAYCQRLVDTWAAESAGAVDYLGEWHKHLEDKPRPSRQDILTLAEIARSRDYHVSLPVLLIIGRSNDRSSLRVFTVSESLFWRPVRWQVLLRDQG